MDVPSLDRPLELRFLAELFVAKLFGEPLVHRLELARKLGRSPQNDSSVFVCAERCLAKGWIAEPVKYVYEITPDGIMNFLDLIASVPLELTLESLPRPGNVQLANYDDRKREAAERMFSELTREWQERRGEVARRAINALVASAP